MVNFTGALVSLFGATFVTSFRFPHGGVVLLHSIPLGGLGVKRYAKMVCVGAFYGELEHSGVVARALLDGEESRTDCADKPNPCLAIRAEWDINQAGA